jgi:hypothetical protein
MPRLFPSLKWYVAVGLLQAGLVVAALGLCCVQTVLDVDDVDRAGNGFLTVGDRLSFHGYPAPWTVTRQHYIKSRYGEKWGPVENLVIPIVPAAMLAIALTLPLILARAMIPECHQDEGESSAPPSRLDRVGPQIILWSMGVLLLSWVLFLWVCGDGTPVPPERPKTTDSVEFFSSD